MGHIPSLETSQQCVIHMGTNFTSNKFSVVNLDYGIKM